MLAPILQTNKRRRQVCQCPLHSGDHIRTVKKLYEGNEDITCNQSAEELFQEVDEATLSFFVKSD